jgi:hypothetical protein
MSETNIYCIFNVPKTTFKYILVSKLIEYKVVRLTTIHMENSIYICAYLEMKFEFYAHLGHL